MRLLFRGLMLPFLAMAWVATAQSDAAPAPQSAGTQPRDINPLFWSDSERDIGFRSVDTLFPHRVVRAGESTRPLHAGDPLELDLVIGDEPWTLERFMADQRTVGILVLHDGRIRLERYREGLGPETRWISFSVTKSITSTLVGAAIRDGHIESLDDPITRYIPQLAGSGYDGVTVRQLLTMSSGVRWNEDYTDPNSDVARFNSVSPEPGIDPAVTYMRTLPRAAAPGTRWHYNTGETNLVGVLVANATGRTLSEYLSEKIWSRLGMEADALWVTNVGEREIGGCCITANARDFARFGQFVLDGGSIDGEPVVPENWFRQAGARQVETGSASRGGYGYQWWTNADGSFEGSGIFGQGLFVDPARRLVIVTLSNWPAAWDSDFAARRRTFYRAVQHAVETAPDS